jgi:hypothetical protein
MQWYQETCQLDSPISNCEQQLQNRYLCKYPCDVVTSNARINQGFKVWRALFQKKNIDGWFINNMEGIQPVVRKCLNPEPLCLHTPENKHRLCNCTRNWNWCCTFSELSKEFAPCSTFIFSQLTCFASYDCPYHILIRCNPEQCVLRETSPAVVNGCWIYFHHWNILNCFYW